MALFEDLTESFWPNALVGIGVVLLAPVIIPAVAGGLRPVVKTLVKGGVMVTDKLNAAVAEAGEQFDDLMAEVRAEMTEGVPAAEGPGAEKHMRKK